jgi:hypothetical protein
VGRIDRHAGELPVAYVVVSEDVDPTELVAWAAARVPEAAAGPRTVTMLPALPLTAVGKPFKVPLRCDAARQEPAGLRKWSTATPSNAGSSSPVLPSPQHTPSTHLPGQRRRSCNAESIQQPAPTRSLPAWRFGELKVALLSCSAERSSRLRNGDGPQKLAPAVVCGLLVATYLIVHFGATR